MSETPKQRERRYAPDLCSIETLAYRLDCSETTVRSYCARGLLPQPVPNLGNLVRWRWSEVEARLDQLAEPLRAPDDDPYMSAVRNGGDDGTAPDAQH